MVKGFKRKRSANRHINIDVSGEVASGDRVTRDVFSLFFEKMFDGEHEKVSRPTLDKEDLETIGEKLLTLLSDIIMLFL